MTFIAASAHALGTFGHPLPGSRKPARARFAARIGDEEGARKALGADGHDPVLARPGRSLEDLARIAFG